jgi:hypothetical protein
VKDFDQDLARADRASRDRSFKIAGEEFTRRVAVRPEVLEEWSRLGADEAETTGFQILDRVIFSLIEPDGHDRWRQLREREQDPITYKDLQEVTAWLVAEETGRPTAAPSPSTAGREQPGTTSTEDSSLREVKASTG